MIFLHNEDVQVEMVQKFVFTSGQVFCLEVVGLTITAFFSTAEVNEKGS